MVVTGLSSYIAKVQISLRRSQGLSGMVESENKTLTQLGEKMEIPNSPEQAVLESFPNPNTGTDYLVRFTCPEFTTLCPITSQPDFAHFVIDYLPDARLVESKSLKLYLASFRNAASFHEDCTLKIANKLEAALKPRWLRIAGYWFPRGGIPVDVFYQSASPPKGLWVPDPGVDPYRGRG